MLNRFPNHFLFGSASAAYQVEGAYQEDGKGESIWDQWTKIQGKTYEGTNGDVAADHYHRFKEDIALMKEMGLKAYRFSVSWSRILPKGKGQVEPQGLQFYHNLIDELIKNQIEPMMTLYHWDLPLALQEEYAGWESRKIVEDFKSYADILFKEYADKVNYFIILNEPNIFTQLAYMLALHPPGKEDMKIFLQTYHHTALVHSEVVKLYKEGGYGGLIGSSIAYSPGYAVSSDPKDKEAKRRYDETINHWFMDSFYKGEYPKWAMEEFTRREIAPEILPEDYAILKAGAELSDFIGINYYQSVTLAHNPEDGVSLGGVNVTGKKGNFQESGVPGLYKQVFNPKLDYTDWDWAIDPDGLRQALVEITKRYHTPIIITENGIGAFDQIDQGKIHDIYRINYFKDHLKACLESMDEGVELLGFCTWSFTDLLSWLNGYQKRYGFVYINFEDINRGRLKKDSFDFYKEVIKTNGANLTREE